MYDAGYKEIVNIDVSLIVVLAGGEEMEPKLICRFYVFVSGSLGYLYSFVGYLSVLRDPDRADEPETRRDTAGHAMAGDGHPGLEIRG